jgi:hypothetical protein
VRLRSTPIAAVFSGFEAWQYTGQALTIPTTLRVLGSAVAKSRPFRIRLLHSNVRELLNISKQFIVKKNNLSRVRYVKKIRLSLESWMQPVVIQTWLNACLKS